MSRTRNLQQHARRFLTHSNRTRFYCSYRDGTLSPQASTHSLQSQIEAALDRKPEIITVLEQWRQPQHRNQLNPSLLRGMVEKLRDSKRFREGLEVSDWMIEQKMCNLIPEDFTTRFHLIENVLGLEKAEKFFESIPQNQRGESIYTALLNSYAKSGKENLHKAESTFQKMREVGLLLKPSPYNSMTSLYSCLGNRDKVDEILQEMKENNVQLDSLTVNNALRVYAAVSDVATMEKFLNNWKATTKLQWLTTLEMAKAYLRDGSTEKAREMLLKTEGSKDPKSYEELMRLYGEAGEREDVYRIWDMYKKRRELDNEGFRALIGSLLKLDDIKGAEEIYYNEWECSGLEFDLRIPTMLASGYREKGMVEKADKLMSKTMRNRGLVKPITPLLEELGEKKKQVKPWELRDLIKELCDSKQFSKALEASSWMGKKRVCNLVPEDYAARLHLIENVLGLEEAEKFFKSSIPENMKNYSVYATLLTSYTRSAKTLDKAEATFEKMEELGFLSKLSPYGSLISLYSDIRKRSKVMKLMGKMKEKNIEPDSVTMNNVLRVNAEVSVIETMDKYKKEWELNDKKLKLEVRTMDAMANAYERSGSILKAIEVTGSNKQVYRLWNEYKKNSGKMGNEAYLSVISSLLKLDDVKGAEEKYKEWKPEGPKFDYRIPSLIISRYCEEEDHEVKVGEVVESSNKKRKQMEFKMFTQLYLELGGKFFWGALCPGVIWFHIQEPSLAWAWPLCSLSFYGTIVLHGIC